MMESIYYKDILGLLESPLGLRLRKAAQSGYLKKEQPFVLGVSADTIYPELFERQEEEEELLIVQGIIDVYFEEQSGYLKKEQPFVLGVSADTIYPELFERQEEEEELLIVQGIIDVYFEEADGIVVVDYKTDRAASREELAERYEKQLSYYGEVLERLTGKRVKEKIIYSFARRYEKQLSYYGEVLERLTGKRVKEKIIYSFARKEEVRV